MATLVSTAMLRPPGGGSDPPYFPSQMMSYSSHDDKGKRTWGRNKGANLNPLASAHGMSSPVLGPGGSSLSKSMKYAETWLYGTVKAQQSPVRPGVYLQYAEQPSPVLISATPNPVQNYAVVVCSCPEYLNGTKKGSTKKVSICKKCKGSRLPLGVPVNGTMRAQIVGGTVRGTQSSPRSSNGTLRAGTVKLTPSSKSRPTILSLTSPSQASDPYDLMRRTRLTTTTHDQSSIGSQFTASRSRARSTSPSRNRGRRRSPSAEHSKSRSKSVNRAKDLWYEDISYNDGDNGNRKSILECDVNPYDLMQKTKMEKLRSIKNDNTDDVFADFDNDETFTLKKLQQSLSKKTAKTSGAYSSVQAISGQRIRIFGESNNNGNTKEDFDYDDVSANDYDFNSKANNNYKSLVMKSEENNKNVSRGSADTRNRTGVDFKNNSSNENKSFVATSPRRPPRKNKTETSEEESENDKKEIKHNSIIKQSTVNNNLSTFVANRSSNNNVTADLTIKSILKKPRAERPLTSTTIAPRPSTPDRKLSGSQFYLPTPPPTHNCNMSSPNGVNNTALQRKKVQFLVENEIANAKSNLTSNISNIDIADDDVKEYAIENISSTLLQSNKSNKDSKPSNTSVNVNANAGTVKIIENNLSQLVECPRKDNTISKEANGDSVIKQREDIVTKVNVEMASVLVQEAESQEDTDNELPQFDKGSILRRSQSEYFSVESHAESPTFLDTMALRPRPVRVHSRQAFASTHNLTEVANNEKPTRPKERPPPPPTSVSVHESIASNTVTVITGDVTEKQTTIVPIKHSNSFSNQRPLPLENTFNRRHTTDGTQTLNYLYNGQKIKGVLVNGSNHEPKSLKIHTKDVRFSIDTLKKEPNYVKTRFVRDKQILEEVSAMIAFDVDEKASVQISTESPESTGIHKISITQNDETENDPNGIDRKTSIMISGDDCYSTMNVDNDAPLYQSSVTINDANSPAVMNVGNTVTISVFSESEESNSDTNSRHSNQIYINNDSSYVSSEDPFSPNITSKKTLVVVDYEMVNCDSSIGDSVSSMSSASDDSSNNHDEESPRVKKSSSDENVQIKSSTSRGTRCHENITNIDSNPEDISRLLRDPVEAVKRNLVPHVCGKAVTDNAEEVNEVNEIQIPIKSENEIKTLSRNSFVAKLLEDPMLGHLAEGLDKDLVAKLIENSLVRLKQSREIGDNTEDDEDGKMSRLIDASLLKLQEEKNCSRPYETFSVGQTSCVQNDESNTEGERPIESMYKENGCSQNESNGNNICSPPYESMEYESGLAGGVASDAEPLSDSYNASASELSTEEDNCTRSKFYQMLVDATLSEIEISNTIDDDHHYESIRLNADPIYEEIGEIPPPLPLNPPPSSLTMMDDDKKLPTRSIFEGASKYDILSYLVDAKERGIVPEDSYTFNFNTTNDLSGEDDGEIKTIDHQRQNSDLSSRVSNLSNGSDSGEDSSLIITNSDNDKSAVCKKSSAEIERNDSGVGSETSKCSRSRWQTHNIPPNSIIDTNAPIHLCEDCDGPVETQVTDSGVMYAPLVCRKCGKKRAERKEIITEIVETEEKYGRDLQIILEEFHQPMLVAGLLTQEQLSAIFLNTEELLENNQALVERLRDALDIAVEQGDEDLLTVNIGKLMLESAPMLHAFSSYCVRQGSASMLLSSLEKEKELLRIFLKVSQMENTVLRRMNLNSFLMVPVQRVTKYPLLLSRLYKVTPPHLEGRDLLRQSQQKIEQHLAHMNSEAKDVTSLKLWRRISSGTSGRRSSSEIDMINIKLRKMAVDVLEWNHDEARFAMEGKLLFTQPNDNNWRKGRTIKLTPINALLVTNGKPTSSYKPCENRSPQFPHNTGIREASLLLIREKGGRAALLRDPLFLDRCVVAADSDWDDYFELQEIVSKDTYIFKAEDGTRTKQWCQQLQYHSQGMGAWRKRRNALANIMINGMTRN